MKFNCTLPWVAHPSGSVRVHLGCLPILVRLRLLMRCIPNSLRAWQLQKCLELLANAELHRLIRSGFCPHLNPVLLLSHIARDTKDIHAFIELLPQNVQNLQ